MIEVKEISSLPEIEDKHDLLSFFQNIEKLLMPSIGKYNNGYLSWMVDENGLFIRIRYGNENGNCVGFEETIRLGEGNNGGKEE